MNAKESLFAEIEQIPEALYPEVLRFIEYLKYEHDFQENRETTFLSESALAKDWSTTEEDEAWQPL